MRPVGQAVKTPPSHGGNRGSIPLQAIPMKKLSETSGSFFLFPEDAAASGREAARPQRNTLFAG